MPNFETMPVIEETLAALKKVYEANPTIKHYTEMQSAFSRTGSLSDVYKVADRIDGSVFGVYQPQVFRVLLYAELVEHFGIKATEWVNPGQKYNAYLLEIMYNGRVKAYNEWYKRDPEIAAISLARELKYGEFRNYDGFNEMIEEIVKHYDELYGLPTNI